jgi:hypothetical protein
VSGHSWVQEGDPRVLPNSLQQGRLPAGLLSNSFQADPCSVEQSHKQALGGCACGTGAMHA